MNQSNQGNNPHGLSDIPTKRKRGRPRKYPKPYYEETVYTPNNHNLNLGRNADFSPGFEELNGSISHQAAPVSNDDHIEVGQAVIGVVDAPFDAGYLITVRAANSGILLRGVVFMTGRYVPVTAENDIAPDVPMIRRNEVPMPSENYTQAHGLNPHFRVRNDKQQTSHRNEIHSSYESQKANQVPGHFANHEASKYKQVLFAENDVVPDVQFTRKNAVPLPAENYTHAPSNNPRTRERNNEQRTSYGDKTHSFIESQITNHVQGVVFHSTDYVTSKGKSVPLVVAPTTTLMSRGTVVPVILQHANLSNLSPLGSEFTPPSVQASRVTPSKGREVHATVNSSNGLGSTSQVSAAVNLAISQSQTWQVSMSMSEGVQSGIRLHTQVATEMLASEVVKRIHAPRELVQTQILDARSAGKISKENYDHIVKDEPLVIESLQTLQPYKVNDHRASAPKPVDERTEKNA